MTNLVIIDYGSGNLRSAAKAAERAARETGLNATVTVSDKAEDVAAADRILLPGVGAFRDCAEGLAALDGMWDALIDAIERRAVPFLGICVGQQLMAREGLEHGRTSGFGWIDGVVGAISPADKTLKIPHMGWNALSLTDAGKGHAVLSGIADGDHAYFVHSYHMTLANPDQLMATVDYGGPLTAVTARDNMVGTQFHPEKSQATGLRLLANFLQWRP